MSDKHVLKDLAAKYMTEGGWTLDPSEIEMTFPDMSQLELKIMAEIRKAEVKRRRVTLWKLMTADNLQLVNKLRKSRARMIFLALHTYETQERGNIRIVPEPIDGLHGPAELLFYYRGTQIAEWTPTIDEFNYVHCGEYEDTYSTKNQRRMIDEAIKEFEKEIMPYVVVNRDDSLHCVPDTTVTEKGE